MACTANLGTLARTCDALDTCMAAQDSHHDRRAVDRGDAPPRGPHIHWLDRSAVAWVEHLQASPSRSCCTGWPDWGYPTRSRNAIGLRRAPSVKDHHELTGGRHRRNDR